MKRILAILAALIFSAAAAFAASNSVNGAYFYVVPSTILTRPADTTTYTANTAVCAAKSVTLCAPLTLNVGNHDAGILNGEVQSVRLLKSGPTTANATFTVWFYSGAPTVTSLYDNVAYVAPFAADLPNYIGSATCSTPLLTNDASAKVWYDCVLSNPNTAGAYPFQSVPGQSDNINAIIEVTAAYAPASAETFQIFISGFY